MKHKPFCPFDGYFRNLTKFDPNGPDTQLTIKETGIDYIHNIHTINQEDHFIKFNFCPCCGEKIDE